MKPRVVRVSLLLFLASILTAASVLAQQPASTKAAQTATEAWLSLIDTGDYPGSWNTAASSFRARVTLEQWQTAVQGARAPFGRMKSRTLKSAKSTTTLPGAPDGNYVVFQFDTAFEHKAAGVETVTAVQEADGTWHVGGYFVR